MRKMTKFFLCLKETRAFTPSRQHPLRTAGGFTLVELMVGLTISLFLLGGLIVTYMSGRVAAQETETLSRIQETMRFTSDHLIRDIRNAAFRDQLTLTFEEFEAIGDEYAKIDGDELIIRYAGRSHCAQSRPDFSGLSDESEMVIIENTYSMDDQGNLACSGRSGEFDSGAGSIVWTSPTEEAISTGLEGLSFQFFPDSTETSCSFHDDDDLETACTGVQITIRFSGMDDSDVRTTNLRAAFRNVIVDQVFGRG